MSSRSACTLLLILLCGQLHGQDWEAFAAASDRSFDPVILQTMAAGDLEVNIALCRGLARRDDEDIRTIVSSLAAAQSARTSLSTELLLRYLLQGVLLYRPGSEELQKWAAVNADVLDMLLDDVRRWKSPQLKGALLSFAVIAPGSPKMRPIADVGAAVVDELQASRGLIPSEDSALVLDFLRAAGLASRSELLPYCTAIARLSRDKVLVDAARATAAALVAVPAAGRPPSS
jgi:hypothetical protein